MNLYQIKAEVEQAINDLLESADPETGEVDPNAVTNLNQLQEQMDEKIDNIGAYYKNLLAEAKMLEDEEKILRARRESKEKKAESLKKYLATALDGKPFESTRVACSWRKSTKVDVFDQEKLEPYFLNVKTDIKPDKTKIKNAIDSGIEVAGARLVESNNIQIR